MTMRCFFLDGCVYIFVKYLQDGFTKWQTHAMSRSWHDDALLFFPGWLRLYRGKIFARWVYPYTNARDDMTTMRCFFRDGCVCIGVKYLQDGFTKWQTLAMTRRCVAFFSGWMRLYRGKIFAQSTESPILDAPFWSDNGVSFPYERKKIADSVLCICKMGLPLYKRTRWHDDDALLFFLDGCVCIGVKYLQDGFTKLQTHAMIRSWHDDALLFSGWLRWYRGKIFARWVYPYTNARDDTTMRCFFQDGCVGIEVKYLQDGFTPIQTHAMTRRCVAFFWTVAFV